MAVTNFIQQIWSKKIQDDLELKCKLVDNCLRDYEGDCKYAQSVKILGVGEPTIGDYDGSDIEIEEMSDRGQILTIDQAKYFAFYVDDVNQAQSVPGLKEKYQEKAVHGLAVGVIEITPEGYNLFKNHLITLSTNNPEYIKKGIVGMYDNFEVVMSNNLKTPGDVRGKKAVAFAGQINEVEALRAEKKFKDIIRGLDTFGAKVIDENRIQVLTTA